MRFESVARLVLILAGLAFVSLPEVCISSALRGLGPGRGQPDCESDCAVATAQPCCRGCNLIHREAAEAAICRSRASRGTRSRRKSSSILMDEASAALTFETSSQRKAADRSPAAPACQFASWCTRRLLSEPQVPWLNLLHLRLYARRTKLRRILLTAAANRVAEHEPKRPTAVDREASRSERCGSSGWGR